MSCKGGESLAFVLVLTFVGVGSVSCDCSNEDSYSTHGAPLSDGPSTVKSACEKVGGSADPVYCPALCTNGARCPEGFSCDDATGFCSHETVAECRVCGKE